MFVQTFSSSFSCAFFSSWFPTVKIRMVWSRDDSRRRGKFLPMHFFRIQIKPRRTTSAADQHLDPAATVPLPTPAANPQRSRSSVWQSFPFARSVGPNKVNHRWLQIWNDPNERRISSFCLLFSCEDEEKISRSTANVSIWYMGFANRIDDIVVSRKVRHRSGLCVWIEEWSIG